MSLAEATDPKLKKRLNSETSRIPWKDLQRFFAGGYTLRVDDSLDLIEVACLFQQDDINQVEQWLDEQKVQAVSDEDARIWYENDQILWAVVVKPWVLVQDKPQLRQN